MILSTTRRWFAITVMGLLLVTILSSMTMVSRTAHAQSTEPTSIIQLGGVNLDGYCRAVGNVRASLDGKTAYDWRCVTPSGQHIGIPPNMTAACRWQYNDSNAEDRVGNYYDPFSWSCFTGAKLLGGLGASDLSSYCQILFGEVGASLDGNNAYSWHCVTADYKHVGILQGFVLTTAIFV